MRIAATITRPTSGTGVVRRRRRRRPPGRAAPRPRLPAAGLRRLPEPDGPRVPVLSGGGQGLVGALGEARIGELLEAVNLTEAAKRPLGKYSGGMLRRVGIAQALLADPRVIIVDEPTAGLDPQERVRFRTCSADLAADRVVMLSTHIVSDIESVASDIAVVVGRQAAAPRHPGGAAAPGAGPVWELPASARRRRLRQRSWSADGATAAASRIRCCLRCAAEPRRGYRWHPTWRTCIWPRQPAPPPASLRRAVPVTPGHRRPAVADFRDRVRRPVYAVTLLAAVGLGYLAVPGTSPLGDHGHRRLPRRLRQRLHRDGQPRWPARCG